MKAIRLGEDKALVKALVLWSLCEGRKALCTQNNSLSIDLSEEDADDRYRDYLTDTIVRPKQVINWPNFVTRRSK